MCRPEEYFSLDISGNDDYTVTERIFEPQLKCLYFLLIKTNPNAFKFIKVDLVDQEKHQSADISKDVHFFEVDKLNPDMFYMINNNVVYHTGFISVSKKRFSFFGLGQPGAEVSQKGVTEFYRSAFVVEFIRFTQDQSKFFVNEYKSIKLIQTSSKEVLKIFNQHQYSTIDVVFDKNLVNLYR